MRQAGHAVCPEKMLKPRIRTIPRARCDFERPASVDRAHVENAVNEFDRRRSGQRRPDGELPGKCGPRGRRWLTADDVRAGRRS